jgi:hypothetical protein
MISTGEHVSNGSGRQKVVEAYHTPIVWWMLKHLHVEVTASLRGSWKYRHPKARTEWLALSKQYAAARRVG